MHFSFNFKDRATMRKKDLLWHSWASHFENFNLDMAQSENNRLGMAQWPPKGDHTLKRYNGICVNFYSRTTLSETFMSKSIGLPSITGIN